jgi:phosphatidylglycerophosphate synthase
VDRPAALRTSIVASVLGYAGLQSVIWVFAISPANVGSSPYLWYFPILGSVHLLMAAFLWWRADDFRHTRTREPFNRVNTACHITLFRLSSAPTIMFLAVGVDRGDIPAIVLFGLVAVAFVSDFFDGQVARRLNQTTDIGAYLDSSTDYAVLVVLSVAFVIIGVTPLWYFLFLFVRLFGFAIAMAVLAKVKGAVTAETTILGKASVFGAMTTYGLELARYAGLPGLGNETLVLVVEITTAVILTASMVDKVVYLVRRFRETSS